MAQSIISLGPNSYLFHGGSRKWLIASVAPVGLPRPIHLLQMEIDPGRHPNLQNVLQALAVGAAEHQGSEVRSQILDFRCPMSLLQNPQG